MRVAVYDLTTGDILRVVVCPDAAASGQALDGEAVVEVGPDVNDANYTIIGGVAVPNP